MTTQQDKAAAFEALHRGPCFIMPNPWDAGSARLLAGLGFPALASSGAGFAFRHGRPDRSLEFTTMMSELRSLVDAIDLPVSADLENGFGDTPDAVAEAIRAAVACGVVGGSIEDATGRHDSPLYPVAEAAERIRAAAEAARDLPFKFVLTARAETYMHGRHDLAETIVRLQAYQEAGADVLFAPGLMRVEDIATLVREVDRPVNVIMGFQGVQLDLQSLAALGVRRISVGGSLARAAYGALLRAGWELRDAGTFGYAAEAISGRDMNALMAPRT
ncbi:isocitrate lyase/phosphoenolpyruvate mutase family protein [Zoogloea sp. LCSB751]|uniref:isocitrate lyase/PEP mutase family protein n=1 Tax=Zoogloea sp. LCSB751 TaxID=1965277 RepID=UPI0009A4F160|nr:isocitrate lyase/phosphoenolpyruvate mutase family protein [Zoogloea sp. LCSB751]